LDNALEGLQLECKKRKVEILAKQKKSIEERRQVREEKRRLLLLDTERQCKSEAQARKLKEKRCLVRAEKRRMRVDPDAAKMADNSREDDEANFLEQYGKNAVMVADNKRSKGKARVAGLRAESNPVSRRKQVKDELRIANRERKRVGRESLRKRVKCEGSSEGSSADNKCKTAERETAESILSLATPCSKPTQPFANSFEDQDQSENEADNCFAGCLTQRVGLDVPTPKSVVKDNLASNRSNQSKLRLEKQVGHVSFESQIVKGIEGARTTSSNEKHIILPTEENKKMKKHCKIFGSSSSGSKSREHNAKEKLRLPLSTMRSTGAPTSKTREKLPSLMSTKAQPGHSPGTIAAAEKFESRSTDRESKSSAGTVTDNMKCSRDIEPENNDILLEQPLSSYRLTYGSTEGCRNERTKAQKRHIDVHSAGPAKKKLKSSSLFILARPEKAAVRKITDGKGDFAAVSSTRENPMSLSHSLRHAVQASGISSGERSVSKSRRRKGNIGAFATGFGGKSVSERVEDFSFNF
jgi:hypothetical protein